MKPNVLFVTVDSLRGDHVRCCASDSPVETPRIDDLASNGVAFSNAFAQGPFTTFSMPSLFTARYPSGLHYTSYDDGAIVGVSIKNERTLVEAFADAGYATAGFHSNPLLTELFNFDRGFDQFDANLPLGSDEVSRWKLLLTKIRRLIRRHAYLPAETLTDKTISWIDANLSDAPIFLWTHYMDPHGPYQSREGFSYYNKLRAERRWQRAVHDPETLTDADRKEMIQAYREEVRYTDRHIGRLVDYVRRLTDRPTVVVLTADHGDGFGEHGFYSHPHELYDELIHVPLIVSVPSWNHDGETVADPVELVDVAPTLLAAADVKRPATFVGQPLTPTSDGTDPCFAEAQLETAYVGAVRTDRWKYISHGTEKMEYLFDLAADPTEQTDVSENNPQVAEHLQEALTDHRERDDAVSTTADPGGNGLETEDVEGRLRRLGYLE